MSNYILAFQTGKTPKNAEHGAAIMAKWAAWMNRLGTAIVNPGAPLIKSCTVTSIGVGEGRGGNPMSGFTLVQAASMEAAIALTEGCPALENDGSIVVSEMMAMSPLVGQIDCL